MAGLILEHLTKAFGGVIAVNDVSFAADSGKICSVIGPNGAGKTTLFNLITGVVHPDGGKVLFDGRDITGLRPDWAARSGICRTFQNIRLFRHLSALENVIVGVDPRAPLSI